MRKGIKKMRRETNEDGFRWIFPVMLIEIRSDLDSESECGSRRIKCGEEQSLTNKFLCFSFVGNYVYQV